MNKFMVFAVLTLVSTYAFLSIPTVFAANIFEDGFESGDFSAWTNTSGSPSVVSTDPHRGTYHADFNTTGTAKYCYKIFAPTYSIIYTRMYLKLKSGKDTWKELMAHHDSTHSNRILRLLTNGDTWRIWYYDGDTMTDSDQGYVWSADNWYCIEMYSKIDGSAGEHKVWINGTLVFNLSGLDNDYRGNVGSLRVGQFYPATAQVYIDCVVVDTSYIGPKSVPAPVGGEWVPINTTKMLVQLVGYALAVSAIAASFVGFKRIKRKQN